MNSYGSAKYNQSDSQPGTNRRVFSLKVLLLASLASLSNAIALNAQQGARSCSATTNSFNYTSRQFHLMLCRTSCISC